jgi:restriction system protein
MSVFAATQQQPNYIGELIGGLAHVAAELWFVWAGLGVIWLATELLRQQQRRRLARSGISEVDEMDGRTFEMFLSTIFERLGYDVEVTKYRGDFGADLVVALHGVRTVVQAKRWRKSVGLKAIQEAVAAKAIYDCSHALVVANRYFTNQAKTLARANGVELWDRDVLVSKLLAHQETVTVSAVAPIMGDECVVCGVHVSSKVRQWCLDRPEKYGGQVYCFVHQRTVADGGHSLTVA